MPPIGSYRHVVTVQNPGGRAPDGDGGFTETWADAAPAKWACSITPATVRDLERTTASTTLTTATHLVRGRFHPGITTASRLLFKGRQLLVVFVGNPEERDLELTLVCAEVLDDAAAGAAATAPPPAWVTEQQVWTKE